MRDVEFTEDLELRVRGTPVARLTPGEVFDLCQGAVPLAFSALMRETAEREGWLPPADESPAQH